MIMSRLEAGGPEELERKRKGTVATMQLQQPGL